MMRLCGVTINIDDRVRVGLAVAGVAACLLIALPPVLLRAGLRLPALLIYLALSPICHQLPARSFEWLGLPLALCARCSGLLWGFTAGAVWQLSRVGQPRAALPHRLWILAPAVLLVLDTLAPFSGLYENTHLSRALTGILMGLATVACTEIGIAELCDILGSARKRKALA